MSRVINPNSPANDRKKIIRLMSSAIQEFKNQDEINDQVRDLVSFLILSLDAISKSVMTSAEAWEKRGYWLKADKFQQEWNWSIILLRSLKTALTGNNWAEIRFLVKEIERKTATYKAENNKKVGTPWVGCWEKLKNSGEHSFT